MTTPSPLLDQHRAHPDASLLEYGPADSGIFVVEHLASLEFEYAALRKGCALFDHAQRGTLSITGDDRLAFLNNMVTQKVIDLAPGEHRSSFWLNRKGRIVADLRLCHFEDRTLVDLDATAADEAARSLTEYVITEDVEISVITDRVHRLSLHGPTAPELLALATGAEVSIEPGHAAELTIGPLPVLAERVDWLGEPGFELSLAPGDAGAIWNRLLEIGRPPELDTETGERSGEATETQRAIRLRPVGWHAINIARIEAGSPLFNLDFGSNNLPAETGLLKQRVDFKKGCYLGQEVVARMDALGKPKQSLVALLLESERLTASNPEPAMPVTGGQVLDPADPVAAIVGAVTSATLSPMLGTVPIAFAMVKTDFAEPGRTLLVNAEGRQVEAVVQPRLRFWPASPEPGQA